MNVLLLRLGHQARSASLARAIDGVTGEVIRAHLCPDHGEILRWLAGLPGPVAVAYEAGPTGFGLARAVRAVDIRCEVAAPSKLLRPAGDRVKTDANDALHLARLLRLDEISSVRVPSVAEEAARDVVRTREDVRGELMRARHRTSKLLLRQGIVYSGGNAWTQAHEAWLARQSFDQRGVQVAFDTAYESVLFARSRRDRLEGTIAEMAAEPAWAPIVSRLQCLRGVSTLTGFGLAVEIGDWHHRRPYRGPSAAMRGRWEAAPAAARARGHAGNQRLHDRWEAFTAGKKRPVVANVAVARELAGWCWSLATLPD